MRRLTIAALSALILLCIPVSAPQGGCVAFNPLDSSHDQLVMGPGAGCYKPEAGEAACASAR